MELKAKRVYTKATEHMKRLGMKLPIMQAPMAGSATPELVAAASNNGCLGNFGCGLLTPEQIGKAIEDIRSKTEAPFGVNLMVFPEDIEVTEDVVHRVDTAIAPVREELGLPAPTRDLVQIRQSCKSILSDQIELICKLKPALVSFCFGLLNFEQIARLREFALVAGTATTVDEAISLEENGVDLIIAQGAEAGGHRATFNSSASVAEAAMMGTMALVPQIVDAVGVPVVAAGGIVDARQVKAALLLGASMVSMGTAFLVTTESGASPEWRSALIDSGKHGSAATLPTSCFSGRTARALYNRYMELMHAHREAMAPYPLQRVLMKDISEKQDPQYSLWHAGQSRLMAHPVPAAVLISGLAKELKPFLEALKEME